MVVDALSRGSGYNVYIVMDPSAALMVYWYDHVLSHVLSLLTISAWQRILKGYIIHVTSQRLRPVTPPASPSYLAARDVSIVVPTIQTGTDFIGALASWLANDPLEIIVVTVDDQIQHLNRLIEKSLAGTEYFRTTITVLALSSAGKRKQMALGVEHAKGSIIVFADDDVFWQPLLLRYVLACFEAKEVGGVGTLQRAYLTEEEPSGSSSIWQRLADKRLKRRNRNQAAMNYLDGGVTCLSGRTAAYRSEIVKTPVFIHCFTRDFWLGRYLLDAGDDTFCNQSLIAKVCNINMQTAPEAEVYTLVLDSSVFLKQVLRWARNSKRSSIRCLLGVPKIWRFVEYSFMTLY